MESPYTTRSDIDNPLAQRTVWVAYLRIHHCEIIGGRWWFQLEGFHDRMCLGDIVEPPFDKGDLIKITFEKVAQ